MTERQRLNQARVRKPRKAWKKRSKKTWIRFQRNPLAQCGSPQRRRNVPEIRGSLEMGNKSD